MRDGGTGDGDPVLAVEDLETHYTVREGWLRRETGRVRAVDGVTFGIRSGEAVGLVGESGCGKSTLAHTILGLETPTGGEVRFDGVPVADLDGEARRRFRRAVQLVVQDPNEAFSPRMTVGEAVAEPLRLHGLDDPARRRAIVADILDRVGLAPGDRDRYPHEFSGGEKQRIAIARALVVDPEVIVADEPTSALDSRVRADVLGLLDEIRRDHGVAVLFISHDIDTVRTFCDRLAVMYLGEFVEKGAVTDVLDHPKHPYTRVLMGSVPSLDPSDRELARPLTDTVPDPADPPPGCRFHTRCPELIRPDGVGLSRESWRAVARLRFALAAGELEGVEPGSTAESTVRERFGLPGTLPDPDLEAAVSDAVSAVSAGDVERASARLSGAVSTVCERRTPAAVEHEGLPVRCHRYDPETEGEPLEWSGR